MCMAKAMDVGHVVAQSQAFFSSYGSFFPDYFSYVSSSECMNVNTLGKCKHQMNRKWGGNPK